MPLSGGIQACLRSGLEQGAGKDRWRRGWNLGRAGRAHSKPKCSNRGLGAPETPSCPWFNILLFAVLKFLILNQRTHIFIFQWIQQIAWLVPTARGSWLQGAPGWESI